LIADAEYLLSVANERLHLVGDINTTREALEAADQRLRESGDAATFKVREEIAKELSQLKSITVPDVVGIYATIQTLQDRVDKLALVLPYTGKTLVADVKKPSESNVENLGLLDSAISQLQGAVVIRHTEHEVKEILTPEEALFIREQLRVKLEMVKISLVQRNEALFQSSLADVKKWTEQNFTKNTDDNSFLADLERLNITKISSQLPDISLSLKMIKDIATLRIETDKAIQPLDAMATGKKASLVESNKLVETLVPAAAVEPTK
jgi:uncharacterized protein HemX